MSRPNTVVYSGVRTPMGCQIWRADFPANPRTRLKLSHSLRIRRHSPTGFEWGYLGSGPAQTALALLLDWTGDAELAAELHQAFKFRIVARLDREWTLTGRQISDAITAIHLEQMKEQPAK